MRKTLALILFLSAVPLSAAIKSETVAYKHGRTILEGVFVYDDAAKGKRPGVLVAPAWKGVDKVSIEYAEELAELGYVAFVIDVYGKGIRPKTTEEAARESGKYKKDLPLLRGRANAGLDQLKSSKGVDGTKLGAIGFCFGGTTALELARSGADVDATVSFHGGLGTATPEDAKNIKGAVLALHGADDPYVSKEELQGFKDEMQKSGIDWQLNIYGDAVHSFTDPTAGSDKSAGAAYNKRAAERAWFAMARFFEEKLK